MTATERHWLAAACDTQSRNPQEVYAWIRRVVAVGGWSLATDRKAMAAIRDGGRAAEPVGDLGEMPAAKAELAALTLGLGMPADADPLHVADLLRWCQYPAPTPCPNCGGKGWDPESVPQYTPEGYPQRATPAGNMEVQCWQCDGDGTAGRQSAGRVCGVLVDKDLLLRACVGPIAESYCRAWKALAPVRRHALLLEGVTADGLTWRVAVMGAEPPEDDYDPLGAKYAPTYVPGVGALWHLIGDGGRYVVADWLEDRGLSIEVVHPLPF